MLRACRRSAMMRALSTSSARRIHVSTARQTMAAAAASRDAAPALESTAPLFEPLTIGDIELKHRIVMAPLTRCRALGNIPQDNMCVYYGQRATDGGLIISEATAVSNRAIGYPCVPGLYEEAQVEGWKPVVEAVKAKGGVFFNQLWHVGRASHQDYQPNGEAPLSSSALAVRDGSKVFSPKTFTMEDYPVPRALETAEIPQIVDQFRAAARNAMAAGFDGVEIHGANGYLIEQFLKQGTNNRTDDYGGCIENRARFALDVVKACCAEVGAQRVGIRLSPFTTFLDASESHPYALYTYMVEELNKLGLAYVHMIEPRQVVNKELDYENVSTRDSLQPFREVYQGTLISAGGFLPDSAAEAVASGGADAVAFGRYFISTPDLVERARTGAPLNKYNRALFYSQGDEGYTDYPFLNGTE